jgi:phage baseplate assembly protein W
MATINVTTREFVDFDFGFGIHPLSKNLAIKKNQNAIKQSVLNLLRLKKGDKPHHPEIYSPIGDYLFENISAATKLVLEGEIFDYLNLYEPRIEITAVTVTYPDANSIDVSVEATIVNTTTPVTINILIERLR